MITTFKSHAGLLALLVLAYIITTIRSDKSKIVGCADATAVSGHTITYNISGKGLRQYFEIHNDSDSPVMWKVECVSIQDQLSVFGDLYWGLKDGMAYSHRFSGTDKTSSSHFCLVGSQETAILGIHFELFRPWQFGKGSTYGKRTNRYILRTFNGNAVDSFDIVMEYQANLDKNTEYPDAYDNTDSYFAEVKPLQIIGANQKLLMSYDRYSQVLDMRLNGIDKALLGLRDSSGNELARIHVGKVSTIQIDGLDKGLYSVELHNEEEQLHQPGKILGHFFKYN
jgi:hypothetical protein